MNSKPMAVDTMPELNALSSASERIRSLSLKVWPGSKPVEIVGQDPRLLTMLRKVEKFARFNEPILITGESGVGKESIAKACYLLSSRFGKPYAAVNCPQYEEGNVTVSQLFGHRKGSFTGAVSDHAGFFETADGGVIFLDEIADLPMAAQVKLLRALAEGEFQPIGAKRSLRVNVRVIAATNRPLERLIVAREFRDDLYFRLRYFPLEIPPLRRRGDDWLLLKDYFLQKLASEYHMKKDFSDASLALLNNYQWPGNVRELKSIVTVGYSLSEGNLIEPEDFSAELRSEFAGGTADGAGIYRQMAEHGENFWDVVYGPFMDRDLNRNQVRSIIRKGLLQSHGSYKKLMKIFRINESDYQRFMDFLRHHRLKSENTSE